MEHNTNRILWTVLILAIGVVLYVGFRPAIASQAQTVVQTIDNLNGVDSSTNSDFTYSTPNTADDTISIIGYKGHKENLIIPEYRKIGSVDYKVTLISTDAFKDNTIIKQVTIPDGVQSIGQAAFQNDSNLKQLTLGSDVTAIGNWAFWGTGLTRVDFPASVKYVSTWAFHDAPISVISFKSPVELNWGAFSTTKLTNVTLPTGSTYKDQTTYDPSKFGQDAGFPTFDSNVTVMVK